AGFLWASRAGDLTTHIEYAQRIRSFADISSPHFLFQVLLKALVPLGLSYEAAAVLLLGACYGGMALLLRECQRRAIVLSPFHIAVVVPATLLASHIFLPTLGKPNLYLGYFAPVTYHNPTQQLAKLLAMWIVFDYCATFLKATSPSLRQAFGIGLLCVVSALAKPTFLLAFLPVVGIVLLVDLLRGRWPRALAAGAGVIAPSVAVLLWQAYVAYGGESGGIAFDPFEVFSAGETLYKLPLSLALPLYVWVCSARAKAITANLRFTAALVVFGLVWTLGFVESNHVSDGNFAWAGQIVVFLAYTEAVLCLCTWPSGQRRTTVAWWLFGLHVVSGVIWFGASFRNDWPQLL
ncbi:MAG TPA: hypothetical protein VIY56_09995, partial [Vicinamibacterales bacterium]